MKSSDYFIILILIVGLGVLGFLFTQQDKSAEEIFADISGKVTGSSGDSINPNTVAVAPTETNNQSMNNPTNTTTAPTSQNPTNKEEALGISMNLPVGAKLKAAPSSLSFYDGETVVDTIFVLLTSDSIVPVIEKFLSKPDFDKYVSVRTGPDFASSEYNTTVDSPIVKYKIDGQEVIEYHYKIDGSIDVYQILVPAKMVSIDFVAQSLPPPYTVEDVRNFISTIQFSY